MWASWCEPTVVQCWLKVIRPQRFQTNGYGISETRTALVDRADALIITPKDTKTMRLLIERCRRAGVPIIAEATGYPGAKTVVAVDNYREAMSWDKRLQPMPSSI